MPNLTLEGILSYPSLMKATSLENFPNNPPLFRCTVLLKRNSDGHHQLNQIINQLKLEKWSKELPAGFEVKCLIDMINDDDPNMHEYIAVKALNQEFNRPRVIDQEGNEIIDASIIEAGKTCKMSISVYSYTKSGYGISAGINGVMIMNNMGELGKLGRIRLTDQQMFGNQFKPVVTPITYTMTEKAAGVTQQAFIDAGWTNEMLVQQGYMHTS